MYKMLANCRWGSLMSVSMGWKTTCDGHDTLDSRPCGESHITCCYCLCYYSYLCSYYCNLCSYLSLLLQHMLLLVISTSTYNTTWHCYYNLCCYLSLLLLLRLLLVIDTLLRLLLVISISITATYDRVKFGNTDISLLQTFWCCSRSTANCRETGTSITSRIPGIND